MKHGFLRSGRFRVLINGIHAKSGGGVTYLRNMLPLLAANEDLELHLFIHRDQFSLFGFVDERIRIHVLEFPNGFFSNLLWEQFALPILARVMTVDVTFSPANYGPLLAPAPIIVLRNSLAVVGRETRFVKRVYWVGLALMTALSIVSCKKAIAVSNYARKALTFGIGGRLQKRVSVIYHGVQDIFSAPPPDDEREDFLLAVSDIYVQKNLHTLIQALVDVKTEIPDISLKIAGRAIDPGYLDEIKATVKWAGLENSVSFLGECSTDELSDLYRKCRIFVFPSTVETFGNPLVEAMASGAPIITSNTAAMPEIVEDAALLFDPLDTTEIARRIIDLYKDQTARIKLGKAALERAKYFSWQKTAEATAETIRSVAAGPKPELIKQNM